MIFCVGLWRWWKWESGGGARGATVAVNFTCLSPSADQSHYASLDWGFGTADILNCGLCVCELTEEEKERYIVDAAWMHVKSVERCKTQVKHPVWMKLNVSGKCMPIPGLYEWTLRVYREERKGRKSVGKLQKYPERLLSSVKGWAATQSVSTGVLLAS